MNRAIIWCAVSTKTQAAEDKNSLPVQEEAAKALAAQKGWNVVDVLRVPGHSRRYIDIHECARDMRTEGITAFDDLIHHWEKRDFDILIVRDGDRFARTQSLHAYIVEKTLEVGAKVFSLSDGLIDENNFRIWIAMGGYKAAGEIDSLVKKRKIGFDARARKGLPVNSKVVSSHKVLRDENSGKAVGIILDESKSQEWLDLATLVLEGIAWKKLDREMFNRFGYGSPLNQPYQPHHYYRILSTPSFWGHSARYFKVSGRGPWVREPGHPIPDGVLVVYDRFEPVYKGELAQRVKAEMLRRESTKGRASKQLTASFTGLVICADCGFQMVYTRTYNYTALRCNTRYETSPTRPECVSKHYLSAKRIKSYVDKRLREMLAVGNPNTFVSNVVPDTEGNTIRIAKVEHDIEELQQQIQRMILKQANVDILLQDQYEQAIFNSGVKLKALKANLKELQQNASQNEPLDRKLAFEEISRLTVDGFWEQPELVINQILHRLMGKKRFVAKDGEIIGVADARVGNKRY